MTVATSDALPALPTALPPVERRATIPAGFRAGGAAIGIKASGRPDLAIIATRSGQAGRPRPPAPAAGITPNAFAAAPVRMSRAHLAATGGWAEAIVSTSGSANAARQIPGKMGLRMVAP